MPRLKSLTGVVVNVDDARAEQLRLEGFTAAEDDTPRRGRGKATTSED